MQGMQVAPHAGAWIETRRSARRSALCRVAPHAGAWIETPASRCTLSEALESRPARARGLKQSTVRATCESVCDVAPHAGAWIETSADAGQPRSRVGRAPRGRVD